MGRVARRIAVVGLLFAAGVAMLAAAGAQVEAQLRSDRGLGPEDDLEAAGFWLPEGGFALPDNMGVVAEGLLFHWPCDCGKVPVPIWQFLQRHGFEGILLWQLFLNKCRIIWPATGDRCTEGVAHQLLKREL